MWKNRSLAPATIAGSCAFHPVHRAPRAAVAYKTHAPFFFFDRAGFAGADVASLFAASYANEVAGGSVSCGRVLSPLHGVQVSCASVR